MIDDQFYADALADRGAILQHGSFNMIHKETMFKVDIFVPKDRPYKNMQFERRTDETLASDPPQTACICHRRGHGAGKARVVPCRGRSMPSNNGEMSWVSSAPRATGWIGNT